jgi:hypothetical protein
MTVRTATGNDALDPYVNDLAGQTYSPDAQCERMRGTGSYLFRVRIIGKQPKYICLLYTYKLNIEKD